MMADSTPTLEGPITGGKHGYPFGAYYGNIDDIGYMEEEFFLSGTATRYKPEGNLTSDGLWKLNRSTSDLYKTRVLVHRPRDANFSGTVIVEWANVSNGYEISFSNATGLYDARFAYVSVSAQKIGLDGYEIDPVGLKHWDPQRYSSLSILDDALSYDIFTQAGKLLRDEIEPVIGRPLLLGGLKPREIIAVGGSQSGTRILAYTNGVQPLENIFHAIMPLVCAGRSADFSPEPAHPVPRKHSRSITTRVRSDLTIPVMEINSETEALVYHTCGSLQPDTDKFRYWEITGSSHANSGILKKIANTANRDNVKAPGDALRPSDVDWLPTIDAAYRHMRQWIRGESKPPRMPLMLMDTSNNTPKLLRNVDGNVEGGICLPELTVPIATYEGFDGMSLGGRTIPFDNDKLKSLYPTHGEYVERVAIAAKRSFKEGIILQYRVEEYVKAAQAASVPPPHTNKKFIDRW
ncbi:hypothetical protein B7463_g164, partial [Scytalidium lignicola]